MRPIALLRPRRVILLTTVALSLAAPAAGGADIGPDGTCTGDPITPDRVVTGTFPAALQGSYVMVPVTVPRGSDGLRVKYCYSQPAGPTAAGARNTLDLGRWDPEDFRGRGGSSHPDVTPRGSAWRRPDLRFSASAGGRDAIMGDSISGGSRVRLRALVDGATATAAPGTRPYELVVQRDGAEVSRLPVTAARQRFRLRATGPGRWGLQLERGRLVVAVTTPIWVTR